MKTVPPLLLPFLLLALHGAAGAQPTAEREWMPYKKLVDTTRLGRFYALPAAERDKLDMFIQLQPSGPVDPRTVTLTALRDGTRTPLPLSADGNLRLVPNPDWLTDDVSIVANLPTTVDLAVTPAMNAVVPPGTSWPYAQLMGSVAQANAVMDKISGPFGMFAPTARSVLLKFDQPARLTIQSSTGTRQHATDVKYQIRLLPDAALLAENPLTTVSTRPLAAELESD
ncbi:hypothetical protein IP91_01266 [Pseudoduganella lurida]|uniref:DUF2987 domain-containing protein n=1 Tax=Pseudoduganella lurida TaxID=1036180 RepID=A0A562RMB8_9BURK|nr:hypothetical protein [Pseudoduganella lurida]TWI70185.1 hypothetical protein IP91_01266 [Pseudoduganella lurida]